MWSEVHTKANTEIIEHTNRNTKRHYNNEMKTGTTWGLEDNGKRHKLHANTNYFEITITNTKTGAYK